MAKSVPNVYAWISKWNHSLYLISILCDFKYVIDLMNGSVSDLEIRLTVDF
jgi:hypothetical protein